MGTTKIDLEHECIGNTLEKNGLTGVNAGPYRGLETWDHNPDKLVMAYADAYAETYKDIGVSSVRTHDFRGPFDLNEIYNYDTDTYDFEQTDDAFHYLIKSGASPYMRIGFSYYQSAKHEEIRAIMNSSSNRSKLCDVAIATINRYQNQFHYTKDGRSRLRYSGQIEYIEIWNEPDHSKFWPMTDNEINNFAKLFWDLVRSLRAEFPDIKIGGPGFTHEAYSDSSGKDIIKALLEEQEKSSRNKLDFVSWHAYKDKVSDYQTLLEKYHSKWGSEVGTTRHHITEWNLTDNLKKNGLNRYEVATLTSIWIWMNVKGIHAAHFYAGIGEEGWSLLDQQPKDTPNIGMSSELAEAFKQWVRFAEATEGENELFEITGKKTDALTFKTVNDNDGFHAIGAYGRNKDTYTMLLVNISTDKTEQKGDTYRYQISTPKGQSGFSTSDITIHKVTANGSYSKVTPSGKEMDLRRNAIHIVQIAL